MEDMEDTEDPASAPSPSAKPRISYACEACRVAKVKCQPGNVEGICRRCAVSKRECVFKTGPRTRRRRSKNHPATTRSTPPPSAPSKTFTIDVPMPAEEGVDDEPTGTFNRLREAHEGPLEHLVHADYLLGESSDILKTGAPSSASGSRAFSASTPSVGSRSVHSFTSIQPQFNLETATSLLTSFRDGMLPYFPVTNLSSDTSVPVLAKERPFILLAILAAASGGKSLQGHNLYDEEFRKVLGLKFVSGGERSLELLIGLLIYCAWFPFHLRPKNRQVLQYIRMATDIVRDLDLDQPQDDLSSTETRTNSERTDNIRAYLATQYLCSGLAATWHSTHTLPFQNWTATCCDILARNHEAPIATADQTLAWLVRLQHLVAETIQLNKRGRREQQEEQYALLMVKGMEAQLREFQGQMPPEISSQPIIRMATLVTEIVLYGSPLLQYPYEKAQRRDQSSPTAQADPNRLLSCASLLRTWYDSLLALPASEFAHFPGATWGHIVASIILGLRLSFPIPNGCPGWDHGAARQILDFGTFVAQFSGAAAVDGSDGAADLAPASSSGSRKGSTATDVLSASKVVIGMVRRKYDQRLAALERAEAPQPPPHPMLPPGTEDKSMYKCPMLDGSMDQYIQDWDARIFDPTGYVDPTQGAFGWETGSEGATATGAQPLVFHDLWATMTMGWSQDGSDNMDFGNT